MIVRAALCVAATSLLSGCINNVQVKDVQQDKAGFLASHFSPSSLSTGVYKTITDADSGQMKFKRIVYQLNWDNDVENKDKTYKTSETYTLTNVGNGLVEVMSENSRNGVPFSQDYQLSYRNLITIKGQSMNLGANIAPMEMEMKSFEHFDPISSFRSGLEYKYKYGTSAQIMNYRDGHTSCERGDAQPASELNATLSGEAWTISCHFFNQNDVLQSTVKFAYLENYGITVAEHVQSSASVNESKIASFTVE
ncbi:hypothetical protein [Dyella monticola]|uniref:hypothetical protein n=1 Tax=Dyella monticola TaxID=1927958 RepID=UPI0011C0350B|nr:hypothetical protein [Dyella monticola]